MPIPNDPYPGPGPAAPVAQTDMSSTYLPIGLAGLGQGIVHGLELGHQWGQAADTLQMHKDQMADNAAYRSENMARMELQSKTLDAIKQQAVNQQNPQQAPSGPVQMSPDGKMYWAGKEWKPMPAALSKTNAASAGALDHAAAAFASLDKLDELGKAALGETSPKAGLSAIPQEFQEQFPHMFATSAINKYNDQLHGAAQWTLASVPHARFSKDAVDTEAKTLGGSGESQITGPQKTAQKRFEVATAYGFTPEQVREHLADLKAKGIDPTTMANPLMAGGGTTPPAGGGAYDWRQHAK